MESKNTASCEIEEGFDRLDVRENFAKKATFPYNTEANNSPRKGVDAYELYNTILGMGILISLDVFLTVFQDAAKDHKGAVDIGIFESYVLRMPQEKILDFGFWVTFLFVVAGILFVLGAFANDDYTGDIIPATTATMFLDLGSFCYFVNFAWHYNFPIEMWRKEKWYQKITQKLKTTLMAKAAAFQEQKETHPTAIQKPTSDEELYVFIKEVIFGRNETSLGGWPMHKKELELVLFNETEFIAGPRLLEDIFNTMDLDRSGSIDADELHMFVSGIQTKSQDLTEIFFNIIWLTVFDVGNFLNSLFFSAAIIGVVCFFFEFLEVPLRAPSSITWLYFVGSSGMTIRAYEAKCASYEMNERLKKVLVKWLLMAPLYNKNTFLWNIWNENNGFGIKYFRLLMEESSIFLPEDELNVLFKKMCRGKSDLASKSDMEAFAKTKTRRHVEILKLCLKSVPFWGNITWLMGGVAYVCNDTKIFGPSKDAGYILSCIGATFTLIGGISATLAYYKQRVSYLSHVRHLQQAIRKLAGKESVRSDLLHLESSRAFFDSMRPSTKSDFDWNYFNSTRSAPNSTRSYFNSTRSAPNSTRSTLSFARPFLGSIVELPEETPEELREETSEELIISNSPGELAAKSGTCTGNSSSQRYNNKALSENEDFPMGALFLKFTKNELLNDDSNTSAETASSNCLLRSIVSKEIKNILLNDGSIVSMGVSSTTSPLERGIPLLLYDYVSEEGLHEYNAYSDKQRIGSDKQRIGSDKQRIGSDIQRIGSDKQRIGISYLCPSGFDPNGSASISASLSSNGEKVYIKVPWHPWFGDGEAMLEENNFEPDPDKSTKVREIAEVCGELLDSVFQEEGASSTIDFNLPFECKNISLPRYTVGPINDIEGGQFSPTERFAPVFAHFVLEAKKDEFLSQFLEDKSTNTAASF